MTTKTTIKSVITLYRFDISEEADAQAYAALCDGLRDGRHWMNCISVPGSEKRPTPGPIDLETEHLFSNQWNSACGFRVFDWYEGIYPNPLIKAGHYLEITDEMREIRRNTNKCGYCGKQESAAKGHVFCPHCLGSKYLERANLHLLRMLPIEQHLPKRPKLTVAETSHLVPLYVEAQTKTRNARAAELRVSLVHDRDEAIATAQTECDGKLWMLDNGLSIENVIYYAHTGWWCFGWRKPLSTEEAAEVRGALRAFPYYYDIKEER